jgi:hypothetical protein
MAEGSNDWSVGISSAPIRRSPQHFGLLAKPACFQKNRGGSVWLQTDGLDLEHAQGDLSEAREVLDYFHSSEHLQESSTAQYGKRTLKPLKWPQATQLLLFLKQKRHVIARIKRIKPPLCEAARLIEIRLSVKNANGFRRKVIG